MTDDTHKIDDASGSDMPSSSQEGARRLVQRADELITLLKGQREMLRQKGMNLPTGSLETVQLIKARLEQLNKKIISTLIELRTLRALADTTALITSNLDVDEVLNQVMDTVIGLTGAERGYIVLKDRDTDEFNQFRVARGLDEDLLRSSTGAQVQTTGRDFMISQSIIKDVIGSGSAVLTTNALEDQRYQQQQSIVGYALRSILAVPLKVRGDLIGIVYCDNRVLAGLFAQRELELVSSFADHAASAIDNARLFQEIRAQLAEVSALRDLLDRIFDSIAAGVITLDAEGTITLCNHAATVMFKSDGPLTGRKLSSVFAEMPGSLLSAMTYVRASARPMPFDTSVIIPGRGECYMNIVMSPVANGQGLALVIDDLTAEKRHEAQITEVVRYLPTALVRNLASVAELDVRGQEREITAMFCDVRGFTSFSETLDPADSMRVINQYLSLASDAINLYEGIVDKYMGDAVTGLFNTQLNPQEDHAVRAVSAGLSMLAELKALHDILPEDHRLFYGIGIDSGLAVLGNVGGAERKEFTALGEPTEISKILQEDARGEVIISESTYQKVKDTFECEPHALEKTSDRADLTAYKVIRRKSGLTSTFLLIDKELADLLKDAGS